MAINFKGDKYSPVNIFGLLCWLLFIAYASVLILRVIIAAVILFGSLVLVALPPGIIIITSLWIFRRMDKRGFGILGTTWLLLMYSVSGLTTSLWLFQGVDNVWIQGSSITSSILCLEISLHKPAYLMYRKLRFLVIGDDRRDP